MFKCQTGPISVGFASIALLLGAMLVIAGAQGPKAVGDAPTAVHFGVTDADIDMQSEQTGAFEEDVASPAPREAEEIFDYTWIFPTEPGADGPSLIRLGARQHD
jgi:hypothetical protein